MNFAKFFRTAFFVDQFRWLLLSFYREQKIQKTNMVVRCLYKQPSRGVLKKRCSENMQQIYGRTLMQSAISIKFLCNFIEIALRFCCIFSEHLWMAASDVIDFLKVTFDFRHTSKLQ